MRSQRHLVAFRRPAPPPLLQFVLLSMLLHVLLILMFGTTNYGGARRGDSLLGSLDVTLRHLASEPGAGFTIAPGADTQLPGSALLRRLERAATAAPSPAAPREAAPPPAPREAASSPPAAVAPPAANDATPAVSILPPPAPLESLPKLDLRAPVEVDKPLLAPTPSPPRPEREVAPTLMPPREFALPPATPLERITPPTLERQLTPPVDLRPRETPIAPKTPAVELQPREEPVPLAPPVAEPVTPAKIEREAAPPVEVRPRELPTPSITPIERIAPQTIERQLSPSPELQAPRKLPADVAPPTRAAPSIERETTPATQSLPRSEPAEVAPGRDRAAPAVAPPGSSPARAESPAGGELPRLRLGAPDVEDDVFRSRRDAPAPEAAGKGPVTLEQMRKRAREIASEGSGSRGVLNLIPPPPAPERKDSLADGIAKAAKPDCRTAYAGMGLLAVVPLVASSVGNGGCNW